MNIPDPQNWDLNLDRWRGLQGEERMLALCCSHIWWAGLDSTSFKHHCWSVTFLEDCSCRITFFFRFMLFLFFKEGSHIFIKRIVRMGQGTYELLIWWAGLDSTSFKHHCWSVTFLEDCAYRTSFILDSYDIIFFFKEGSHMFIWRIVRKGQVANDLLIWWAGLDSTSFKQQCWSVTFLEGYAYSISF